MKDRTISLPRILTLHPLLRDEVVEIFEELEAGNVILRCVYGLRTWQEQADLYAQGRTRPGRIVTKAQPGFSYHNYGLAIDCCLLRGGDMWSLTADDDHDGKSDWLEMVEAFERRGWEAGFRWTEFSDSPHFQKTFDLTITACLAQRARGEIGDDGYLLI